MSLQEFSSPSLQSLSVPLANGLLGVTLVHALLPQDTNTSDPSVTLPSLWGDK